MLDTIRPYFSRTVLSLLLVSINSVAGAEQTISYSYTEHWSN